MKFIKIDRCIYETTGLVIFKIDKDQLKVTNSHVGNVATFENEKERDAEFDRLEKLLMGDECVK